MQTPMLKIDSTHAQIGMKSQRPPMQIRQAPADMTIDQNAADLKISRTASKLYIDQTEAFADANLKKPLRLTKDFIQEGQRKYMQYLAQTARQGDQMMRIENGGNVIPQIAKQSSEDPPKEFGHGWMPRSMDRIKIQFEPSKLNINVKIHEPVIQVRQNESQIHIPKWQTDVYMKQKSAISIEVAGLHVNRNM